jgi:hypothetical protein
MVAMAIVIPLAALAFLMAMAWLERVLLQEDGDPSRGVHRARRRPSEASANGLGTNGSR